MKLTSATMLGLVGVALGQYEPSEIDCPTATKTVLNPACARKTCDYSDCSLVMTVQNPCGCPASFPTATLIAPCEADCPYGGCGIEFRTNALPCPTTTSRSHRPRPTSSPPTTISIGITTLPPHRTTTTTPCPTVTKTTMPADCPAMPCPVPTCLYQSSVLVPCGCNPKTMLYVQGCPTACPDSCLTRTQTISAANC
ncbi:hypothetical protein QBC46DRAFT_351021 [Diplogelasinospora grovesii]|uniref:Uncharacterized protein n=1 Tax=Diplogelasinospora grovesii TaxID=303347 RepID=A0AAN6NF70_9PEZI|nr:hypothetical protein QBC46DRAFT_351021 [Diplogelasinospora grovesii]